MNARSGKEPAVIVDGGLWHGVRYQYPVLDSTNTRALQDLARLREGDLVVADLQTAGRGRFDRRWMANPGQDLTFSLVLKDAAWSAMAPNLGQIAAWALARLADGYAVPAELKWPNDVLHDGRKLAGILVERGETGIVLGVGLNVNSQPGELARLGLDRPAASLAEACGRSLEIGDVMPRLLTALGSSLDQARAEGLSPLWHAWSSRDWLKGRTVQLSKADGEVVVGEYLGINTEGGLRLRTLEGYEHLWWSGDVERVIVSTR